VAALEVTPVAARPLLAVEGFVQATSLEQTAPSLQATLFVQTLCSVLAAGFGAHPVGGAVWPAITAKGFFVHRSLITSDVIVLTSMFLDWHRIWFALDWVGLDWIWFDSVWFDLIWFDLIWFDLIWFDLIWFVLFCSVLFCFVLFRFV